MTTAADDFAVEDAFEALLAGRPVPEGAAGLAAFTASVRATATSPGRPSAALAELLATGLLIDQSSPSARTARSAGTPPSSESRVRRRRRSTMFLPALFAKFLSAGAIAQAATGAGVVLVAFTGAGAAGVLPGTVQDTFATVVAAVTPLEAPTSEGETTSDEATSDEADLDGATAEEVTDGTTSVEEEPAEVAEFDAAVWLDLGPEGYDSFGAWVSAGSSNADVRAMLEAEGRNFGSVVSEWAHNKGLDEDDLAAEGVDLDALTDDSTDAESDADVSETEQTETTTSTQERGSRGNGNGGGNGNGNGNGGGNGNGRN